MDEVAIQMKSSQTLIPKFPVDFGNIDQIQRKGVLICQRLKKGEDFIINRLEINGL
jgi:hypothetical protein